MFREVIFATVLSFILVIVFTLGNNLSNWREMMIAKRDLQNWDLLRSDYKNKIDEEDKLNVS